MSVETLHEIVVRWAAFILSVAAILKLLVVTLRAETTELRRWLRDTRGDAASRSSRVADGEGESK